MNNLTEVICLTDSGLKPEKSRRGGEEPGLAALLRRWVESDLKAWIDTDPGLKNQAISGYDTREGQGQLELRISPDCKPRILFHEAAHLYTFYVLRGGAYFLFKDRMEQIGKDEKAIRDDASLRHKVEGVLGTPIRYGVGKTGRLSWLGNLVDESRTMGEREEAGHPMDNGLEFFASTMTTLMFAPEKFFGRLEEFGRLAGKEPKLGAAYARLMTQFGEIVPLGLDMAGRLRRSAGFGECKEELDALDGNLAKLKQRVDTYMARQNPQVRGKAWMAE